MQDKYNTSMTEEAGLTAPRVHFPCEPELALETERRQLCSKKHEQPRDPITAFLLMVPTALAATHHKHVDMEREKQSGPQFLFLKVPPYSLVNMGG